MNEEYITKEKYDYEINNLAESLTGIARDLNNLKDENNELRKRIYKLEQFSPMKKV